MIDPYLRQRLTETCNRLGLPPWETSIRPRLHAQADAIAALMAQVRADAQAAQGIRPRDRHGRYTSRDGKR